MTVCTCFARLFWVCTCMLDAARRTHNAARVVELPVLLCLAASTSRGGFQTVPVTRLNATQLQTELSLNTTAPAHPQEGGLPLTSISPPFFSCYCLYSSTLLSHSRSILFLMISVTRPKARMRLSAIAFCEKRSTDYHTSA